MDYGYCCCCCSSCSSEYSIIDEEKEVATDSLVGFLLAVSHHASQFLVRVRHIRRLSFSLLGFFFDLLLIETSER